MYQLHKAATKRKSWVRQGLVAVFGIATILGAVQLSQGAASAETGFTQTAGRPFATTSPWNTTIPANPSIDVNSTAIKTLLSSAPEQGAAMYDYGVPIFNATSTTPTTTVTCTEPWGTCPIAGTMRIPTNAKPSPGSDGAMVVIDWTTNTSYEFWQAAKQPNGTWTASWGAKINDTINGNGTGPGSTASNISRLAGVIRIREIANANIPHALVFASKHSCQGTFRAPATSTDGPSTEAGCIPQGARVQLDPSVNVDAIPNISRAEKAIAKALQTYGAYNIDTSGAKMAFSFEMSPTATASAPLPAAYTNNGLLWDYYQMNSIPWDKLRVLSSAGGTADTTAPTAPASLTTSNLTPTSVKLNWATATDNVGVTGYNVWRGDANYDNWVLVGSTAAGTTTYTDATLSTGTGYVYAVRAVDAANNISAGSPAAVITTP